MAKPIALEQVNIDLNLLFLEFILYILFYFIDLSN